jgi:ubiquinone/menaquinone biosynthesis C-methylase UbiE
MRGIEQIPWMYDAMCAVFEALGMRRWREWLARGAKGRTLDIGCGTGRNLPLYAKDVDVVGVDPAWPSLLKARRRAAGVPLVRARAEALPFRDATFETVVSGLVFCSVLEASQGLVEVKRVLRRGGSLRMLEHVRSTTPWKARWQDFIQPFWTWAAGGCHPNRNTEATVESAGFRIDPETRRSVDNMRRFVATPAGTAQKQNPM